jgi:hypothetical protein
LALAALVVGVAHLARPCGCSATREPSTVRLSPAPAPLGVVATTMIATPVPVKEPVARPTPQSSAPVLEPTPALASAIAIAAQDPKSGTSPTPSTPKQAPPARKQRPPPDDPDDNGSNGGLGVLPKGVDPEYEGLGVMCLSLSTGRPVVGVQVRALTAKELDAWSAEHPGRKVEDEDPKIVLEGAKPAAKTNAYGITITESGPGRMLVDALIGNQYAFAWVDRDKVSQVKLTLVEDHDLAFHTHAPDGSACTGIPVIVSDDQCQEIWRGVTQGDDATVHMPHASYVMERHSDSRTFTASVEGVFPSSSSVSLVGRKLPSHTLDFVVPATRTFVVHVKDPQGKAVTKPFAVTLMAHESDPLTCEDRSSRTTQDGSATFERVESRRDATFSVYVDGGDVFESTLQRVDAHQDDVDVAFARAFRVARMKVQDAAGKPLDQGRVRAWLGFDPLAVPAGHGEWITEKDGGLSIPLGRNRPGKSPANSSATPTSSVVLVQVDSSGDTVASVAIPIPDDFTAGEHDFGSVRMTDLPFIVQGYVVDDRDAAVPGARVRLRSTPIPNRDYVLDPLAECAAVSDTSGFFKLRGVPSKPDIDLVCEAPDLVMMPLDHVERGDKKVRIVMARLGTLVSKFLLPPGLSSDLVSLEVIAGEQHNVLHPDASDIVHMARLTPGKITLEVRVTGISQPVITIADVDVKPGGEVTDPRAVQIDLRQRVFQRTLHVNDPDGKPIGYLTGRVIEDSEDRRLPRKITGEDGVMRFVTTQAAVDVNVTAPGFVTQELHGVDKDMDVTLERAPR